MYATPTVPKVHLKSRADLPRRLGLSLIAILLFSLAGGCARPPHRSQPLWFTVTLVSLSGPNRIHDGSSEAYDVRFTIRRSAQVLEVTPKVYLLDRDGGFRGADDWLSQGEATVSVGEDTATATLTLRCENNRITGLGTPLSSDSDSGEGGGIFGGPAEIYARVGEAVSPIIEVICAKP